MLFMSRKNFILENYRVKCDVKVVMIRWSNFKKIRWGSLKFKKFRVSKKKLELFLWS